MKSSDILYIILTVLLVFFCQKDWGTQKNDLYTSIEGPPYSEYFSPDVYDINFSLDPESLKIGSSIFISADVSRNDHRNLNVDLYYRWYVNDSLVPHPNMVLGTIYYNIGFLFLPTLNGKEIEEGFSINSVVLNTSSYRLIMLFRERAVITGVVDDLGNITVSLNIGYKDTDGIIKFFCKKDLEIPIYY